MQIIRTERGRDYRGPVTNTDIWADFALRRDDIIVDTPPKCGTTWTLSIVMMLIHGRVTGDAGNREEAPWLDCAFRDRPAIAAFLDGLERRRCIKSHTPMDGIPYAVEPTYIVVYRHPVDVHFSFRSHIENMKDDFLDHLIAGGDRAAFHRFVDAPPTEAGTDDLSVSSIVHHYLAARARQDGGNVHFFHYRDLSRDLAGQIGRLAGILKIPVPPRLLEQITRANTFENARLAAEARAAESDEASPFLDDAAFYASGTSNKWENRLSDDDLAAYHARIAALLPPDDVAWLNWGDRRAP